MGTLTPSKTMVEFLLFCLATVGMTSIITQGVIFQPFRQFFGGWAEKIHERREQKAQATHTAPQRSLVEWFSELINCAQCAGFWCGLFCGLIIVKPAQFIAAHSNDPQPLYSVFLLFCCGLGGSFLSALGCNVIDWVFYRKMNALRHLEEQDLTLAERRANAEQSGTV